MSSMEMIADAPPEGGFPGAAAETDAEDLFGEIEERLARLRALPLAAERSDEHLALSVERLARIERMVAAEQLRRIAAVDERGAYLARGARSTATMLSSRLGLTGAEARTRTDTANALAQLPQTAEQLSRGALGVSHAETAARTLREVDKLDDHRTPEERIQVREELDDIVARRAGQGDRRDLATQLDRWAEKRGERTLPDRERRAWRRRRAWLSGPAGPDGMMTLFAQLDGVGGAHIRAALDALMRKEQDATDDTRTPEQRCADALVDLAKRALDGGGLPRVAAQRPHVLLITSVEALEGRAGADPSLLDGYGPVSSETARLLSCDADITTIATDRNGTVLDVGRTRRDPTSKQRAAVVARDRRCVGCGAPVSRCQVHHVHWWSRGGPTDFENLCVLCWDCHANVHHHGWEVTRDADGAFLARPPETDQGGRHTS